MITDLSIPTRKEVIAKVKAEGFQLGAIMPFHYPRALLRAFDIHPMEIWGPPHVEPMEGKQHFPEYTCQIVQKATRFLQSEQADSIDCILIPHTCDSLQGMASVFKDFIKLPQPIYTLYHPRGRRASDLEYLEMELRSLSQKITDQTGKTLSEERLHHEIDLEERVDRLVEGIAHNRGHYTLTDRTFYTFLRSREYLPVQDFIDLAESLPKGKADLKGPGLLLSGIVPEPLDLFDHINSFGAHVIIDDLACCSRRIYRAPDESDAFKRLAGQLISMPPDPTVSTPYAERFEYLKGLMNKSGARAVVVFNVKFCEPELFYIPMFEDVMKQAGWPFIFIENELTSELPEQIVNRLNSFVEVLS